MKNARLQNVEEIANIREELNSICKRISKLDYVPDSKDDVSGKFVLTMERATEIYHLTKTILYVREELYNFSEIKEHIND
jgi:hypothetical protein